MRFLVVSPYLPHSCIGHGGGISIYNFLRTLARRHEVTCLCFQRRGEASAARELSDQGVRMEMVPFRSENDAGLGRVALWADRATVAARARLARRPFFVQKYLRPNLRRRLTELIGSWQPDVVQVEYMFMAPYARVASRAAPRPLVLLSTHEAGTVPRLRRLLEPPNARERSRRARDLRTWMAYERRAVTWADVNLCVSDPDRRMLRSLAPAARFTTLPLGIDTHHLPVARSSFEAPPRLLFVGSFAHPPNRDAAVVLLERIFPRIRDAIGDVHLDVVGKDPPPRVKERAVGFGAQVRLHGFVEDLDPLFDQAWLFVAPLFSGGGIKIKILEALGRQVPVLTTPIGLEGIELQPGEEVASASNVEAFADEAVRWLRSPSRARQLAERGAATARQHYGWPAVIDRLEGIVAEARGGSRVREDAPAGSAKRSPPWDAPSSP
jgi:glycosyltransferase involved in cell wall biosynthesis